jgi:hypothetical protein
MSKSFYFGYAPTEYMFYYYRTFCDESGIVTWVIRTLKSVRITALDYYVNAMEAVIGQLCNRTAGAVFQQRIGIFHF